VSNALPTVDVIIATMCSAERAAELWRAVDSALSQQGVRVRLSIIANGARVDAGLLAQLRADPRLTVHVLEEGSYPAAVRVGRLHVTQEFFSFLDDDDEYLPGALETRLSVLQARPELDFVATGGYVNYGTSETTISHPADRIAEDPIRELLNRNWLQPCGHLFRSATVTEEFFDGSTKYFEWTILGFRLCLSRRVAFIDVPTYRKHDMPGSLFKHPGVAAGYLAAVSLMSSLDTTGRYRKELRRHRVAALHVLSEAHRRSGSLALAWKCHLMSLRHLRGWRHLPYTRHLLRAHLSAPAEAGA
jgi:hypothetical protein